MPPMQNSKADEFGCGGPLSENHVALVSRFRDVIGYFSQELPIGHNLGMFGAKTWGDYYIQLSGLLKAMNDARFPKDIHPDETARDNPDETARDNALIREVLGLD